MNLQLLQEKVGSNPDGIFGKNTILSTSKFYKITEKQAVHFFAQISHETAGFKYFTENLNYSATGLRNTFSKYFPTNSLANLYARQPEKIANRVYANRMGNGDENSGDGWKYRGRGAIQLTGKANYKSFSDFIKDPEIMTNPDLIVTKYAFESAIYFFSKNKLWNLCTEINEKCILDLTKRINGGTNGLAHRSELTYKYYNLIK